MQVKKNNDQTVLKLDMFHTLPLSSMTSPGRMTTTVGDHDRSGMSMLLRSVYIDIAMMTFLQGHIKFTQPLLIQSLMGLKA
ncbi:hypothetical protein K435DRAFT_894734 [Dendrothele bispora CBS 962.96]|uniref:Uncharacterized protein n=1 Tax=Dendrothele bispora (strain CBS 962.96) TaxID=1314807 RepID=A0A4S8M140_DENBC|nr:hypothetical protein K435DRAFT_894734 [Dendrothele bispora CBS 962.96]